MAPSPEPKHKHHRHTEIIVGCIALFGLTVAAFVMSSRLRRAWNRRFRLLANRADTPPPPIIPDDPPELWDVRVQHVLLDEKADASEIAWDRLQPLALRVSPADAASPAGMSVGLERAKSTRSLSSRVPRTLTFPMGRRRDPDEEDLAGLVGGGGDVAVLIAMPTRQTTQWEHMSDLALGTAEVYLESYYPSDESKSPPSIEPLAYKTL